MNKRTPEENGLVEVAGLSNYCAKDFFNDKERKTGIALENYVYFKDDTHYFVMCAKKQSLLAKGVFIKVSCTFEGRLTMSKMTLNLGLVLRTVVSGQIQLR